MKLAMILIVATACAGDPGTEDKTSPSCEDATTHADFAWIQANVFTKSCVFSGCHTGAAANAGRLNLTAGMAYGDLVGVAATGPGLDGWKRVAPSDPAASYLLVALGHGAGPMPVDGYMPINSPAMCEQKIDAIQRWIVAGAQP